MTEHAMRLSPHELRDVTLAQAIERADDARTLVSQTEWDEATRQAVDAARGRGVLRVGVADVVVPRAAAIVDRAAGRDTTVACCGRRARRRAGWRAACRCWRCCWGWCSIASPTRTKWICSRRRCCWCWAGT